MAGVLCVTAVVLCSILLTLLVAKVVYRQDTGGFLSALDLLHGNDVATALWHIGLLFAVGLVCSTLLGDPMKATAAGLLVAIAVDLGSYGVLKVLHPHRVWSLPTEGVHWFFASCGGLCLAVSAVTFVRGPFGLSAGIVWKRIGRSIAKAIGIVMLVALGIGISE